MTEENNTQVNTIQPAQVVANPSGETIFLPQDTETAPEKDAEKAPDFTAITEQLSKALEEAEKWKALSRKNESRASDEHSKASTLEERLGILERQSQEATATAAKAQRDSLILKATTEAKLPPEAAGFINGEDAETIAKQIATLATLLGTPKETQTASQGFSPDWLTAPASSGGGELSADELFTAMGQQSQN